ncbi:type IV secretion system DNA-binding domain-containing protein [Metallibacterium scheffleri]|nr:type IV secretion system DNA-binding domain-containing protein [Metallibacterium scheffleri]
MLAGLATVSTLCMYVAGPFLFATGAARGWSALIHWPADPDRFKLALHALALLAPLVGGIAGGWLFARQPSEQHRRGALFYRDPEAAARAFAAREAGRTRNGGKGGATGISIAGVPISRRTETEHTLLLGGTGGGKSLAVIYPALDQALARGDRVIAHDPKGDVTAARFDAASCVLLGPWDERASTWDAAADFFDASLVDEFASTVCGADSKTAGKNLSFHQGGALLLGGLIKANMAGGAAWTWASLAAEISATPRDLIKRAAIGDALVIQALPTVFANPNPNAELGQGELSMLSILGTSSRFILQLAAVQRAHPGARLFSLRRWMLGESDTEIALVLLNNNMQFEKVSRAIFGAMLAVIAALAASSALPEKPASAEGATWLILDEARQLGPAGLEAVQRIAEVGRSRGMRVILGLQDADQLAAEVGREASAPMLSMQGLRLYLRCAPPAAEQIARTIGEREILRIQSTATAGAVQGKTSTYDRLPVLMPSDLTGLNATQIEPGVLAIELIAHAGDELYQLVARVVLSAYKPRCPAAIPSLAWGQGTLPAAQPQAAPDVQPAAQAEPEQEPDTQPETAHDDDNPDNFGSLFFRPGTGRDGPTLE